MPVFVVYFVESVVAVVSVALVARADFTVYQRSSSRSNGQLVVALLDRIQLALQSVMVKVIEQLGHVQNTPRRCAHRSC